MKVRHFGSCATAAILLTGAAPPAQPAPGDHHIIYHLASANADLTYRVYAPRAWRKGVHLPLVVILHGFGGNADQPFAEAKGALQAAAEKHRMILVAPAGYDGRGDYGANLPLPALPGGKPITAANRSADEVRFAEEDVMAVLHRVAINYGTDPARTFLMGNSMGMVGTLHLAAKYPGRWCGIAPSDGPPWPDYPVQRLQTLAGVMIVHGEADKVAHIEDSRALAQRMAKAGINVRFVPVPNGEHPTAWTKAIPRIFAFFDSLHCGSHAATRGTAIIAAPSAAVSEAERANRW